jgi:ribonuclease HI
MRPDGTGSGFAWVRLDRDEQRIYREDGLTNNMAEWRAVIAVLRYVRPGSQVLIMTDSQLVAEQFAYRWAAAPKLADLRTLAQVLMDEKDLQVTLRWIPREQNLAGKLLERR